MERARQEEWERQHASEKKREPYNPFEGMKRQATMLKQQSEKSPRQPPALASGEGSGGQTFSPAASLQR